MEKFISIEQEIEAVRLLDTEESICAAVDFRNQASSPTFGSIDEESIVHSVRAAGKIRFLVSPPVLEGTELSDCPIGHYLIRYSDGQLSSMDNASFTRFFKLKTEDQ